MSRKRKQRFRRDRHDASSAHPPATLVTESAQFQEVLEEIRDKKRVALDTEFHAERVYHPRLYLVQVAVGDRAWAVDPLELDISPLVDLIAEPGIETVVHAGGMDIGIFHGQFGKVPSLVFDTQVAAGFAGFDYPRSLAKLTNAVLGVELRKGQALSDWSQRPLSAKQLDYALEDVRYLLGLREAFVEDLDTSGRRGWFEKEMVERMKPERLQVPPEKRYRRISGWARLPGVGRAVLRELAVYRESVAADIDRPLQQVMDDRLLLDIARLRPRSLEALGEHRRIRSTFLKRHGDAVLLAIEAGIQCPPEQQPEKLRDELTKNQQTLAELLTAAVRIHCKSQGLAFELVDARANIRRLIRNTANTEEQARALLAGWHADFLARTLSGFLSGDLALALDQSTMGARFVNLVSDSPGSQDAEPGPGEP